MTSLLILRAYAKLDDASLASSKLPPTVHFSHTPHTLTIFDAYPKALFHFLILPRLPSSSQAPGSASAPVPVPVPVPVLRLSDPDPDHQVSIAAISPSSTSSTTASAHNINDEEGASPNGVGEGEGEGLGGTRRESLLVTDSAADLTSLRTLLRRATESSSSPSGQAPQARVRAEGTLRVLADEAARLRLEIEREMLAHHGFTWPIWTGFHAVPSLE